MTVLVGATRAGELSAAGEENNPIILWDNEATTGNISSLNGDESDGAATNCVNGTTFDYALPTVSANEAALEISGTNITLRALGIAAHNLGTLGASVRVQYSDNGGSTWTDSGAGPDTPADDQAILWRFDEQTHDDWRLLIFNVSSGQPAIGVLVAGVEIVMPRRIYQGYAPPVTPNQVTLQSNVSEGGHLLGSASVARGSSISAGFQHVPASFVRGATWRAFQSHFNTGGGFFWAWRPTKYDDCHFAWRAGAAIAPENTGPKDMMGLQMGMRLYDDP